MSGIAAVIQLDRKLPLSIVSDRLELLVQRLSNRGQNGFGLVALGTDGGFETQQSTLPARELATAETSLSVAGRVALAHIHNTESGETGDKDFQPFIGDRHSLSMSGAIVNHQELKKELLQQGAVFHGDTDAELLLRLIESICQRDYWSQNLPVDYGKVFKEIDQKIDGAVSALLADKSGLVIAYRNQNGLRPLDYMQTDDGTMLFASENAAFAGLPGKSGEVLPSHIKIVDSTTGECLDCFVGNHRHEAKLCAYETLYLGNPKTKRYGQSLYDIRRAIGQAVGQRLASRINSYSDNIVVASMPETGRPYADGVHDALAQEFGSSIERQEIIELQSLRRTLGTGEKRKALIEDKYRLAGRNLLGKTLIMADEALIYGETSHAITKLLHGQGVAAVHWAIGSLPVVAPNYYGVGVHCMDGLAFWKVWQTLPPDIQEQALMLESMDMEILECIEPGVANLIKADSLTYLPYHNLVSLLPGGAEHNDLSLFTLHMPTPAGQRLADASVRRIASGLSCVCC